MMPLFSREKSSLKGRWRLETVISLDGWLYSDTTDHYVGGKGFRSVTEAEATAVMDKYTHETLVFTPFVV